MRIVSNRDILKYSYKELFNITFFVVVCECIESMCDFEAKSNVKMNLWILRYIEVSRTKTNGYLANKKQLYYIITKNILLNTFFHSLGLPNRTKICNKLKKSMECELNYTYSCLIKITIYAYFPFFFFFIV